MNLRGSIAEIQNILARFYLKLAERFQENILVRELWNAMAADVSQQVKSLNAFPESFWNQLRKDQEELFAALQSGKNQVPENKENIALRECFEQALRLEETVILKVYAPILRSSRENSTERPVEFYILVKTHLARISRAMEFYSGDPLVVQNSNLLREHFEREVQHGQPEKRVPPKPARDKKAGEKPKEAKHPHVLAQRAKSHHDRSKPLVEKIDLHRRRAHR